MSMEIEMPKYVDSQVQILWWEADEFIITCTIVGVGLLLHSILWPSLMVFFVVPIMSKMKRTALEGAVLHILYSAGLIPLNKEFNDALETEFYQ